MKALEFMWRGGYTARYHTHATLTTDTVGHHSYNVACIIMALRPNASAQLLRAALKHDMAEHVVGDMPAPAKRGLPDYVSRPIPGDGPATFREVFAAMEADHMNAAGVATEPLLDSEEWVLKLADSLDGMRFCVHERKLGNVGIHEVFVNFRSYASSLLFVEPPPLLEWMGRAAHAHAEPQDVEAFDYLVKQWGRYDRR